MINLTEIYSSEPVAPSYKRRMLALFAVGLLLIGGRAATASSRQPDVLVIVYAAQDGQDKIGLTYPSIIPRAQVNRDLQTLQADTGWAASHVDVSQGTAPIAGAKEVMTSVEFTVHNAIDPQGHYFTLEPVVSALRAYPHVQLAYFVGGKYDFQGLRSYNDKYVSIMLDQRGSAFTYDIRIHDPKFLKLNLPLFQPPGTQVHIASVAAPSPPQRRVHAWQVVMIAVIAALAGGVVYFITSRNA